MDKSLLDLSEAYGETLSDRVPDSLCAVCFAGGHECPAAHHAGARNIGLCTPCREGRNCEVFATQPAQVFEEKMRFFVGLHQPSDAKHFDASFISVNRIRDRKSAFEVGDWIMDSGAFTEISTHGRYRHSVEQYAESIIRWRSNGNLLAAVSQDYMCEPFILAKTGLTVSEHQRLTIERYEALLNCDTGVTIIPVLQGFDPGDYADHIRQYGGRLTHGQWVGVGSVCKRNGNIRAIEEVLLAIHNERPDLRLHGFGLKTTALSSGLVQELLHTADSMSWSFAARIQGRSGNDWREAKAWSDRITERAVQMPLYIPEEV